MRGIPLSPVPDRIGLAVDDVDKVGVEIPASGLVHDITQFVDVGGRVGGVAGSGGPGAVGGSQAEFHRPQGSPVDATHDQGRAEFVAGVVGTGTLVLIVLGGVGGEGEHTPVVNDQGNTAGASGEDVADGILGGLDQGGEKDGVVLQEPAHGADGGIRTGGTGEHRQSVGGGVERVAVPAHEIPEAGLQPAVELLEEVTMRGNLPQSKSCDHTYAQRGEVIKTPQLRNS